MRLWGPRNPRSRSSKEDYGAVATIPLAFDSPSDGAFAALEDSAIRLSQLHDTSGADVQRSKAIFEQEIQPEFALLLAHLAASQC